MLQKVEFLLQLTLLLLLALATPPASSLPSPASNANGGIGRRLWRWMSLTGGPTSPGEFPHAVKTSPPPLLKAPCDQLRPTAGEAWRARVRTPERNFSVAFRRAKPWVTILTPLPTQSAADWHRQSPLPTIYRREGEASAFALSRTRLLGLRHCQRLPATIPGDNLSRKMFTDAWQSPGDYAVWHHAYSPSWQLWLRGDGQEALSVHQCVVVARWTPTSATTEVRQLDAGDGVFKLPQACYRVEL